LEESEVIKESIKLRDKAITALLVSNKVSYEELCELKFEDINFSRNTIRVGGKDRRISLEVLGHLFSYWIYGRPHLVRNKDHDYFFVTKTGKKLWA